MGIIDIERLKVVFPYKRCYPEQINFMSQVKLSLDANGPCVLEMPPGSGRTVALFSLMLEYMSQNPNVTTLVYCVETLSKVAEAESDLKLVYEARKSINPDDHFNRHFRSVTLGSKSEMCINPVVLSTNDPDLFCQDYTLPWCRQPCTYFEGDTKLKHTHYSVETMVQTGRKERVCPYYTARRQAFKCNVVICSQRELLDPRVGEQLRNTLSPETVIVFDDSSRVDIAACDVMTHHITKQVLIDAADSLKTLQTVYERTKELEPERLQKIYNQLRDGLTSNQICEVSPPMTGYFTPPFIPKHIMNRTIPGTLRQPISFIEITKRLLNLFSVLIRDATKVKSFSTPDFLTYLYLQVFVEPLTMYYLAPRLVYFLSSLEITDVSKYAPLFRFFRFLAVISTYDSNFSVIIDRAMASEKAVPIWFIQAACLDASLAFSPVFDKFRKVVFTGTSVSPHGIYPQILGFEPIAMVGFTFKTTHQAVLPITVSRSTDQSRISTEYGVQDNSALSNSLRFMVEELSRTVPDGLAIFFPNLHAIHVTLNRWKASGALANIQKNKLIFIESHDPKETMLSIDGYRKACDVGRGAIYLGVTYGQASKGTSFEGHYSRCVIIVGLSDIEKTEPRYVERAKFLDQHFQIPKDEFISFNNLRHSFFPLESILSSKTDYSCVLLVDYRYDRPLYSTKLTQWISGFYTQKKVNQTSQDAIDHVRKYFVSVAQPDFGEDDTTIPLE